MKIKTFLFAIILFIPCFQKMNAQKNQVPFPIVPLLMNYEFAPLYFAQIIENHSQYAQIEAIVNQNVYQIILTEKESNRRVYYSNTEAKTKALLRERKESYTTEIDFKQQGAGVDSPPNYGLGFRDKRGQAILWRFIPASRASERGAGLIALPDAPGLRLVYRNLGSLAGEGTVVQIGDKIIEASAWPEVSSPPYFVAHRGYYSEGRDIGALYPGEENWRVSSSPKELSEGAKWTLVNEKGDEINFQITSKKGDEFVISEVDAPAFQTSTTFMNVKLTPQGFAVRSVTLVNDKRIMRVTFTPELNLFADKSEAAFQIDEGKQTKIAQGIIQSEKQTNGSQLLKIQPKSPDWAKSKLLKVILEITHTGYKIKVS